MKKNRALWMIIIVIVVLAAAAAGALLGCISGAGFRPKLHGRSRHTALFMHSIRP